MTNRQKNSREVYQLRIYEVSPDKREIFHNRFKDHALRIMKRYGFEIIALWESTSVVNFEFVYLLRWPDAATMQESRLVIIAGVTTIFAICLFLFTAIIFSVAVLSALRRQRAALLSVEREVALETALVHLEKTTGVKVPSPVAAKKKPVRRLPSSMIEQLMRQY